MDSNVDSLVRAGRFKEALAYINALPFAVRRMPEWQIAESELLVDTGDIEGGFTAASRLVERAADVSQKIRALRVLGEVAFYRGNAKESERQLRNAYELARNEKSDDPTRFATVLLVKWRLFSKVTRFDALHVEFEELKRAVLASGAPEH